MAEGGEDSQRLKKIAAAAFDYENDARWADYWSNILIPPHMASRPEVVDHFKRKFYQRYIDPDLVVEPMSTSSSSSQSARPTATSASSTASSNANEQVRSRNSGQLSLSDIFLNSNELFLLLPKTYLIVCLRIGSSNLWAICYDWCNPKFNALG
jgi:hypothetical protein